MQPSRNTQAGFNQTDLGVRRAPPPILNELGNNCQVVMTTQSFNFENVNETENSHSNDIQNLPQSNDSAGDQRKSRILAQQEPSPIKLQLRPQIQRIDSQASQLPTTQPKLVPDTSQPNLLSQDSLRHTLKVQEFTQISASIKTKPINIMQHVQIQRPANNPPISSI